MQSNTITSKCFLCGAAPAFTVFVLHSLVCAEKGPSGQWAAEWRVQWRPTSLAASTECVLLEEQPYILSRFVELESAAGDGEVGGKWWGGLVARWLTSNCSMPVFRAWHSLSVFVLFFFLTSPPTPPHPTLLLPPPPNPLPAPPSHQFTCLALLVAEVYIIKWSENTQNRANHRGFYNTPLPPTKKPVISFSTVSILKKPYCD